MNTIKQLIKSLKLNYVNSDITEENFPDDGQRGKVEILHFNEYLETDEVLKRMEEKGYRPTTLYEMLEWAKDWNGQDWIVALGSVWRDPCGGRSCACLDGGGSERGLGLIWVDDGWDGGCRVAAVRKSLDTGKLDSSLESRILELENKFKKLEKIINL